jgi:hypothetical protein
VICRPFVGPLYCTIKNARRVTLIIYIIGIFYTVPLMFEYEPHEERSLSELFLVKYNKNIYRLKLSELGSNSIFRWIYVLINALAVYVVPLTIIGILNRKLLTSIRLLEQRSAEYNAPLPTKQGKLKKKNFNLLKSIVIVIIELHRRKGKKIYNSLYLFCLTRFFIILKY